MAARAREHEIRMTEIYLRAMSGNTNEGNHFPHLQLTYTLNYTHAI